MKKWNGPKIWDTKRSKNSVYFPNKYIFTNIVHFPNIAHNPNILGYEQIPLLRINIAVHLIIFSASSNVNRGTTHIFKLYAHSAFSTMQEYVLWPSRHDRTNQIRFVPGFDSRAMKRKILSNEWKSLLWIRFRHNASKYWSIYSRSKKQRSVQSWIL